MPELSAEPEVAFSLDLSPTQVAEIWGASSEEAGIVVLARIADLNPEEPRIAIWLDFMFQSLHFSKLQGLSAAKTLAVFTLLNQTHEHAVDASVSKPELYRFFSDKLLSATKNMPIADRFTLQEVEAITAHARTTALDQLLLIRLVFTQPQTVRRSEAEYFVQQPAAPCSLSDTIGEPPEDNEATDAPAAAPSDAADLPEGPPTEEAEAPANAPETAPCEPEGAVSGGSGGGSELTEAIGEAISSYMNQLKTQMTAEYEAREAKLRERIDKLEKK